jgi:ubiquinone/menaquinone biosynthesis C-methylase UbiE
MSVGPDLGWNAYARVHASQRWRQLSAAMGRHVTYAIVEEAQVGPGMRVLDVASGTGEPAITVARLLAGTGSVVASDVSPQALAVGEQRAQQHGLTNLSFVPADAHRLPFPDASFDRVTSRLGIMFFADPALALREMRRVLRPKGRASLLAWGPMEQPYFSATIGTVLRLLPELQLAGLARAIFRYAPPGTLRQALLDAGFARADEHTATAPWNWGGTPEDFWAYFQDVSIPFHPLFAAIPAERKVEVDAAVIDAAARHRREGVIKMTASIVLASGTI